MSGPVVPADPCRAQLQRVLESEGFRNSESLRRLLAYIAERSLNHTSDELKEYVIGLDVFGKPATYDPQKDASVRVQASRLRQKLEDYYSREGRTDPYRLILPKGRFTILFEPQTPGVAVTPKPGRSYSNAQIALIAALALLAVSIFGTAALWMKVERLSARVPASAAAGDLDAVWGGFLAPDTPAVVVFGSPAFFASTSRDLFLRMYRVPNPDQPRASSEFRELDTKLGPLQGPRYDYASMGDAIGVQRLTAFLSSQGVTPRALPAHLTAWENIQDANVIFVGAARMNPLLRRLPVHQDFELQADDYIHNLNPLPGEQNIYATPSHRDSMTYAVAGTYAGLVPGREILVVEAHSTPGTVGAIEFLTSPEGVRVIRGKLKLKSGERKHFQVLLRVFTDNDSPVKTEYVTHHLAP